MKFTTKALTLVFIVTAAAACGTSTEPEPTGEPTTRSEVASYEALVGQVRAEAASYHAAMSPNDVTPAMCQSIHEAYDRRQRGWLSEMMPFSGHMDDLMAEHGGMMHADNGCLAAMMMDELDHHHAVACAAGDWAADRAEGLRHAESMGDYASWAAERCDELMAGLDGKGWHFGPMTSVCLAYGEDCGDAYHHGDCCGGMMHCGP